MYKHHTTVQVRTNDLDMFGHVNNAVFLSYLEVGRVAYLIQLFGSLALPQPFVVRRVELDFLAQILFGAVVTVETRVARIGNSSLSFSQRILADGQEAARAVVVAVALHDGRPAPLQEEMRAPIRAFDAPEELGAAG